MHPYATEQYARSLLHAGEPFLVPEWGCHVLRRPIPQSKGHFDGMGPYPVTIFKPDSDMEGGMNRLRDAGFVSIVAVVDPIAKAPPGGLEAAFEFIRPFKRHYIFRARNGPVQYNKHHRYEIKQALKSVAAHPIKLRDHIETWSDLYANLSARHQVTGVQAFGRQAFEHLAGLEGLHAIGAFSDGQLISCHLWIEHDGQVWSHLAASSDAGYRQRASYAIYDATLSYFSSAAAINFGGGAGNENDDSDGLARFKRGFANDSASAMLCGKVLDLKTYAGLTSGYAGVSFFPAYRAPKR